MTSISRRDFLKLGGAALLGISAGKFIPPQEDEPNFTAPLIWSGSRKFKRMAFTYDDCYLLNKMQDLEELLNELLVLINMTSGARPHAARLPHTAEHYAFMTEPLVDEYSTKC